MRIRPSRAPIVLMSAVMLAVTLPGPAMAHCDSMDGPVVKDAQRAIDGKNVTPVLKWVRAADEDEIRRAFQMVLAVRGESDAARTIADRYFFETLVRVHRASEGEGFTGLKPAGSVDPAIAAADKALADGNIDKPANELAAAMRDAVRERFALAHERRQTAEKSVDQGREYVEAYVQFTHFVESAHDLIAAGASHRHRENRGSSDVAATASPAHVDYQEREAGGMTIKDVGPQPQSFDLEEATRANKNYRTVAWSGRYLQLTLMSIPAGGDIGLEVHAETDQFLRLDAGRGRVEMGPSKDEVSFTKEVSDGWSVLIPAGTWHNIINIGQDPMQVYAIYAPAHHKPGKTHKTVADAASDSDDEPADWSVQPAPARGGQHP